ALPGHDRAVEEQPALRGDLIRDEQVEIAKARGEEDAVPERPDADAAVSFEVRGRRAAVGPVELVLERVDDHVIAGDLTEVDARLVDLGLAGRRDVLHGEDGAAIGRDGAHLGGYDPGP